jgi:hypothetical protein
MKWILNIVGALMILTGGVWGLQGVGVLPGSFMSGQLMWLIIGAIVFVAGVVLLVAVNRPRHAPGGEA